MKYNAITISRKKVRTHLLIDGVFVRMFVVLFLGKTCVNTTYPISHTA